MSINQARMVSVRSKRNLSGYFISSRVLPPFRLWNVPRSTKSLEFWWNSATWWTLVALRIQFWHCPSLVSSMILYFFTPTKFSQLLEGDGRWSQNVGKYLPQYHNEPTHLIDWFHHLVHRKIHYIFTL